VRLDPSHRTDLTTNPAIHCPQQPRPNSYIVRISRLPSLTGCEIQEACFYSKIYVLLVCPRAVDRTPCLAGALVRRHPIQQRSASIAYVTAAHFPTGSPHQPLPNASDFLYQRAAPSSHKRPRISHDRFLSRQWAILAQKNRAPAMPAIGPRATRLRPFRMSHRIGPTGGIESVEETSREFWDWVHPQVRAHTQNRHTSAGKRDRKGKRGDWRESG